MNRSNRPWAVAPSQPPVAKPPPPPAPPPTWPSTLVFVVLEVLVLIAAVGCVLLLAG